MDSTRLTIIAGRFANSNRVVVGCAFAERHR